MSVGAVEPVHWHELELDDGLRLRWQVGVHEGTQRIEVRGEAPLGGWRLTIDPDRPWAVLESPDRRRQSVILSPTAERRGALEVWQWRPSEGPRSGAVLGPRTTIR